MQCKCGAETSHADGFEVGKDVLCKDCFLKLAASAKGMSGEERQRLKRMVQDELAGLLPRSALEEVLEQGYGELLKGADFDETVRWTVNRIEQLSGMAIANSILDIVASLKKELGNQEDELRDRMRRLGNL